MPRKSKEKGRAFENKVAKTIGSGNLWFSPGDLTKDNKCIECIEENQRVLMSDFTLKSIKDIKVGDEVVSILTNDLVKTRGKRTLGFSLVTDKTLVGERNVGQISDKENSLILTPEHFILNSLKSNNSIIWTEAQKIKNCKLFKYNVKIENLNEYYIGFLLGLIDSDGSYPTKTHNYYFIYQKSYPESVEWIFKKNKIKYSKNGMCYRILKEHSEWIEKQYKNFKDESRLKGWLSGFILGDGSIVRNKKSGRISIGQNIKNKSYNKLLNVLNSLNINYNLDNNGNKNNKHIRFPIEKIPFYGIGKKFDKFKTMFNKNISVLNKSDDFKFKDLEIKKKVYDITTTSGNFICEGFVVHNCKYTDKKGFRISLDILEKLWNQSLDMGKEPHLIIGIKRNDGEIFLLNCDVTIQRK